MKHLTLSPLVLLLLAGAANAQTTDDRSWHLMQKRMDGSVVVEGLSATMTKHECEFARARAMGLPATVEEERAQRTANEELYFQKCPPNGASNEDWKKWQEQHPFAQGCANADGNGGASWGGGRIYSPTDIFSAECFQ